MGSAFHQLCPRYSGTLKPPTAPTTIRLWDTFTFTLAKVCAALHEYDWAALIRDTFHGMKILSKSLIS